MTAQESKDAGFLPSRVASYVPLIDQYAQQYGIDPIWVCAIGDRETNWGTSKLLDIKGPKGAGDFTPRNPVRWKYAIPPDGRGWGRGLMQIDYGSYATWCLTK